MKLKLTDNGRMARSSAIHRNIVLTDLNLHVLCLTFFIAVVPQPVYMNMSDLANMAATRAAERQDQREDGLDLKTPTQEDLDLGRTDLPVVMEVLGGSK